MHDDLALSDGEHGRRQLLPYGCQTIDEDDIAAVVEVLRSDWLTTGPKVGEFEEAFATFCGASHAVAVSSGTAALHCMLHAAGIGKGDEVIVPALTFAATANAVLYCGGVPIFADVTSDTLLIDVADVERKINPRTKAIIAVDYAGQPCQYTALNALAQQYGIRLFADACHSLGGALDGRPVGSLADASTFSFHPVKPLTTGEGGMITTNDEHLARRMRIFRNHGITTDHRQREQAGSWLYEMIELGFNYRLSDIACALGRNQLKRVSKWTQRRGEIALRYREGLADFAEFIPLTQRDEVRHAYHLFVVRLSGTLIGKRAKTFDLLRAEGVGVNVHYIPVYWHPFYQTKFGYQRGLCPVTEAAYDQILSLPIFPEMRDADIMRVILTLRNTLNTSTL